MNLTSLAALDTLRLADVATPHGLRQISPVSPSSIRTRIHDGEALRRHLDRLAAFVMRGNNIPLSCHPDWLMVAERGLRHPVVCIEAIQGEETVGILPLAFVSSLVFGRFLVSLPYVNYGGTIAENGVTASALIDRSVELAEELDVRFVELRHARAVEHPALTYRAVNKVNMRLDLPVTPAQLWGQLSPKVRNQIRKGQRNKLHVAWGGEELLPAFFAVFSRNMRDLGTPVFGEELFRCILRQFAEQAELCVIHRQTRPIAAALILHGLGVTEVPSASSLREYNPMNANMFMYWHLLERAIEKGQRVFDFGRAGQDTNTYRFKKQWGAMPEPAEWQYYLRDGVANEMRPDNPKYQWLIALWRRLPVHLTRLLGPSIVRVIP